MHKSTISKKMNLLYTVVDPSLYTHHSPGETYPTSSFPFPTDVDEVLNITGCTNDNKRAAAKNTHVIKLKSRNNIINMNAVLVNTFLGLVPNMLNLLYKQERMMNQNAVFHKCFDWVVKKYGHTKAKDCETNWMAMDTDWHPLMGFEVLTSFFSVATNSRASLTTPLLTGTPPALSSTFSTAQASLPESKMWILRGDDPSKTNDFISFKTFWENVVQIASFTSIPASQHGYCLAVTNNNASTHSLTDAVLKFGMAYAATQESL